MKTILVVDDDATFAETVRAAMGKDFNVVTAPDGIKGLEIIKATTPDAILLDINMPNMNGIEFLHKLRAMDASKQVPVVITSNDSSMETISEGTALGVRGYIIKSNESLKTIMGIIEKLFTNK